MALYAAVPFGFALARPGNALWAALLLASFAILCLASVAGRVLDAYRTVRVQDFVEMASTDPHVLITTFNQWSERISSYFGFIFIDLVVCINYGP
jgi:hypothetical protein